MNLSSFDAPPVPLEPQETLSFEDIAPLLSMTTSTFGRMISCGSTTKNCEPLPTTTASSASAVKRTTDKIVPTDKDILCGRDKVAYGHVGNRRFRVIVAMNRDRYQHCTARDDKTRITTELIKSIRESGARFLKLNEDTNVYEDVGDEYAHEKVSHALRSAKDPNKRKPAPARKKRKVVRKPPTPEENEAFEFLYSEQQRIFKEMLAEQQGIQQQWISDVIAVGV